MHTLSEAQFDQLVDPVWSFLAPCATTATTSKVDAIFVFGGLGMEIPTRAAALYHRGVADHILVSGDSGPLTVDAFPASEARVFADKMVQLGVPRASIHLEEKATNTGQNVQLGMEKLAADGIIPRKLALVAKGFLTRRAMLTFGRQYPQIVTVPLPAEGPASAHPDRPREKLALRLVDELRRLRQYQNHGFIAEVTIPVAVRRAEVRILECFG